jgi:hypothetical protein
MQGLIIEPHYIPNLRYFSAFLYCKRIIIDDLSLFRKQSYRNRANILSANGILSLIVPVCKGRSKIIIKDIKIDNTIRWQKNHWNSIVSAYNKSAYFQFYNYIFEEFYKKKYSFLLDLNIDIIKSILNILSYKNDLVLFSEYSEKTDNQIDFRNSIDPKPRYNKNQEFFKGLNYHQVFADRFSFIPDLSIIDLIFNQGPGSVEILEKTFIRPS